MRRTPAAWNATSAADSSPVRHRVWHIDSLILHVCRCFRQCSRVMTRSRKPDPQFSQGSCRTAMVPQGSKLHCWHMACAASEGAAGRLLAIDAMGSSIPKSLASQSLFVSLDAYARFLSVAWAQEAFSVGFSIGTRKNGSQLFLQCRLILRAA